MSLNQLFLISILLILGCEVFVNEQEEKIEEELECIIEDYFVVAEQMPVLIGGLGELQQKIEYPEEAIRAGIEGRVTVQFIVTEIGKVACPRAIRGIGGGCDEAAIKAVSEATFSPGIQGGKPVPVQYSLPIVFRLPN